MTGRPVRLKTFSPGSREGIQHSTSWVRLKSVAAFVIAALMSSALLWGCLGPPKPKLDRGYAWGRIRLEMKSGKTFRMDFEPGSRWAQFGPLEGETSLFGNMLALYPKTLSGMTEDRITQDAFKLASEQGVQVDLMAVRNLMRNVKMDIEGGGAVLRVTDPPAKDPDKHPLAGAVFSVNP